MKYTFMHQPFCCFWVNYDIGRVSYAGCIAIQIDICYGRCRESFLKNLPAGERK